MAWQGIEGHDQIVERFRLALRRRRLGGSLLFVGPKGVGKHTFALRLAQALFCKNAVEEDLDPCGRCSACQQVTSLTHPDLHLVSRPTGVKYVPPYLLIGDRFYNTSWESRHRAGRSASTFRGADRIQEQGQSPRSSTFADLRRHRLTGVIQRRGGLLQDLALKPYFGGRRIVIIDDADCLSDWSAACLFHLLEEPPPLTLVILVGVSEHMQHPKVRSRCSIVRFGQLTAETVAWLLISRNVARDWLTAASLAAMSDGSVGRAIEFADDELSQLREVMLPNLGQADANSVEFTAMCQAFINLAGEEAASRRVRMLQVIRIAIAFYRQLMRSLVGLPIEGDGTMVVAVRTASPYWRGREEAAADCLERCLEAECQLLAGANQTALTDCWLDDLIALARRGYS